MDIERFWNLIEVSKLGTEDCEEQIENLSELLTKIEPAEIIDFDRQLRERLVEAYRWDLWAVAYIINGGCSDDGFEYFRGWLIAQGKDYFEAALRDPQNAAQRASVDEEAECESIFYAASQAYEEKTGEEMPATEILEPAEPAGQKWNEADVEALYPRLAKRFG